MNGKVHLTVFSSRLKIQVHVSSAANVIADINEHEGKNYRCISTDWWKVACDLWQGNWLKVMAHSRFKSDRLCCGRSRDNDCRWTKYAVCLIHVSYVLVLISSARLPCSKRNGKKSVVSNRHQKDNHQQLRLRRSFLLFNRPLPCSARLTICGEKSKQVTHICRWTNLYNSMLHLSLINLAHAPLKYVGTSWRARQSLSIFTLWQFITMFDSFPDNSARALLSRRFMTHTITKDDRWWE